MRIRVGVSSCLLGHAVRYDGRHKSEPEIVRALSERFELVPVCPEEELGLGAPREPIHLVRQAGEPRLVGVESGSDHTEAMMAYAGRRAAELWNLGVRGFVLKSASPSCGPRGVPVEDGQPGSGLFVRALYARLGELPIAQECDLVEAEALEQFMARVISFSQARETT